MRWLFLALPRAEFIVAAELTEAAGPTFPPPDTANIKQQLKQAVKQAKVYAVRAADTPEAKEAAKAKAYAKTFKGVNITADPGLKQDAKRATKSAKTYASLAANTPEARDADEAKAYAKMIKSAAASVVPTFLPAGAATSVKQEAKQAKKAAAAYAQRAAKTPEAKEAARAKAYANALRSIARNTTNATLEQLATEAARTAAAAAAVAAHTPSGRLALKAKAYAGALANEVGRRRRSGRRRRDGVPSEWVEEEVEEADQHSTAIFIDPGDCNTVQLIFLTVIYGQLLFDGANAIGDGSELLLLVPQYASIVGSVVLPLLGAVPDGMMVLVSGFGKDAGAKIAAGVGALAGSTIMLLTIPWFSAMYAGRVDIIGREPQYKRPKMAAEDWSKLTSSSWFATGVGVGKEIGQNAWIMVYTACLYLIMQLPAVYFRDDSDDVQAENENWFAFAGMVTCAAAFVWYMRLQFEEGGDEDLASEKRVDAIKEGKLNLSGAMDGMILEYTESGELDLDNLNLLELGKDHPLYQQIRKVLSKFFAFYDINRDHQIDEDELRLIMKDLREEISNDHLHEIFAKADVDKSGYIEFDEFVQLMIGYLLSRLVDRKDKEVKEAKGPRTICFVDDDDSECGDEEEDVPEDLADLSPEEQQQRIKSRAFWTMGWGLFLVTVFSDPMVDCFTEIGKRLDIPVFYVSFTLAPVASNAAEILSAYAYSSKKTAKSMTIALSTLEGAACMNNTLCLGIFYFLIWYNEFPWKFTAETISIMGVEILIGLTACRRVTRFYTAVFVLCMYPVSLLVVYGLENWLGLD